jgi:aryl-phospho-beta-D-glucosidase BglC (GH1 family)
MLFIKGNKIFSGNRELTLRGVAIGGWLMMEGYMLGGENIPETAFKQTLIDPQAFSNRFRRAFITPADAQRIKGLGFNCVRIPFNHKLIEAAPFQIDIVGMEALKQAVKMFADLKIYVILDMHAVPGCQNPDWHADASGKALFWEEEENQKRYFYLWEELSKAFKNEEMIAGYDIMNEPVTEKESLLIEVYKKTIDLIRTNGDRHIIFLEGNHWARETAFMEPLFGENIALSVHFYEPIELTFNWQGQSAYPGVIKGENWGQELVYQKLKVYAKHGVPVFVGEFGVSSANQSRGRLAWLEDVLAAMAKLNFHWTYWTYKSAAPMNFPDGLYQLCSHDFRMEKVPELLKKDKEKFYAAMDTSGFTLNQKALDLLLA